MNETIEQRYRRYLENRDQMEVEARQDLEIDLDDCFPNLLQQANTYSSWGQIAAIAASQFEAMKQHLTVLEAECREKAFANLTAAGEKATEQRVKDTGIRDPSLAKHQALKRHAELFADRLKVIVEAFKEKKDMLIQVSARQRYEFSFYQADEQRPTRQRTSELTLEELKERATRKD